MGSITVRTPFRITLAGGGSDIREYSRRHGGYVVGATIDKWLTVTVTPSVCSGMFDIEDAAPVYHYAYAAGWRPRDAIKVESDIPDGSGLGGSGALMVSLLKARNPELTPLELATAAYNIERYSLRNPTGIQDAYVAAFGSCAMTVSRDSWVCVLPVSPPEQLQSRLALFATGIQREAGSILSVQAKNFAEESAATSAMHRIVAIGRLIFDDMISNQGRRFGELTHQHWLAKRATGPTSTDRIDQWYNLALDNGAQGGKVCGAGAGGYMLFVVEPKDRAMLIQAMTSAGLEYTPFQFVNHGAKTL